MLDELGGPKTYNHYPNGWAMAFNTPFKMWKRYEFNGGTCDPCIISWPAGMKARGEIRDQYHHAIDLVPTILDVLGVEAPETIKGHTQTPIDGVSMRDSFDDAIAPTRSGRRSSTRCSARGRSGTRAGRPSRPTRRIAGWGHFNDDEWELYHTDVDRSELHNLAAEQPDKVRELVNIWFSEAGANGAFPLDDRSAVEIMHDARPAADRAARPVRLLPGRGRRCPSGRRSTPRNRSFMIGALVDIPAPGAQGVLFAHRLALRRPRPLRQGQPAPLRQQLRRRRGADDRRHRGHPDRREPDPVGLVREGRAWSPTSRPGCCRSTTATRRSARARSRPSSGRSRSPARGSTSDAHGGEPVTDDYPGESPYAFTGGTIDRVAVDVSGEPYVDLEREAAAMLMREYAVGRAIERAT